MIALFTALIVPWFVDWTSYRAAFETEASRILGQPVSVAGRASVRLLPLPTVSFGNVTVGRYSDGQPMMTIETFSMVAELLPFLSGEVKIVDMRIERPKALIRVNTDGTTEWTSRKEMIVDPEKVRIENVRIVDGSLELEGLAGGRAISGTRFNARIAADALTGPWRVDAQGEIDGTATRFTIGTGRLQEDGSLRVSLEANRPDQPYQLLIDGPAVLANGVLGWTGKFALSPSMALDGKRDPRALPILVSGQFAAKPGHVDVPEYRLDIGQRDDPYTITGKAEADYAGSLAFRIEADGRQIDIDRIGEEGGEARQGQSLSQRLALVRSIVDKIPVPPGEGVIDFELPAIVAGDTVIREISAKLLPDGAGWKVARLAASLPGNTSIEASGHLGIAGNFGFTGKMLVASRQPTGFANWLSGGSNSSLRRLKSAGFAADVTLTQNQTSFDNLELALDGVIIRGSLQRMQPEIGRPAIIASLSGDVIDVDDLRAIQSLVGDENGKGLSGHDLDIALKSARLRHDDLEASEVDAHLRVTDGVVSVERFNAGDFYGASIKSSGKLLDILGSANGSFGLRITAPDASALTALARDRLGNNGVFEALLADGTLTQDLEANFSIEARPEGNGAKATITGEGSLGGTRFTLSERFEGQARNWQAARHDLSVKLQQDTPHVLARQLSLPALPVDSPGPVSLDAEIAGLALEKLDGQILLRLPQTEVSLAGGGRFLPRQTGGLPDFAKPQFAAHLTMGSNDIDPYLFVLGIALPGAGEGTPLSLDADLAVEASNLVLSKLSGQFAGNGFSGDLALAMPDAGRAKLTGSLSLDTVSLPVLAELVAGTGSFAPGQTDGGQSAVFGIAVFEGVDFGLGLAGKTLETGLSQAGSDFTGRLTMTADTIALPQFTARWLGGVHAGAWSLKNTQGGAVLRLSGNFTGINLAGLMAISGHGDVLTGSGDFDYSLEGQGRSLDGVLADLSGSGTLAARDLVLSGIRSDALGQILAAADADKFEVSTKSVEPLAVQAVLAGETLPGEISGAFSVQAGTVETRNLTAALPQGRLAADASINLASGIASVLLTLAMDGGKDALSGAEPAVGIRLEGVAGAMQRTIDTTALEGFLSLRAFEREQRRVDMLQAAVLEKQRLRRETISSNARMAFRQKQREDDLARLEALQQRIEEERKAKEALDKKLARDKAAAAADMRRLEAEKTAVQPAKQQIEPVPPLVPKTANEPVDLLENLNKLLLQ